MTCVDLLCIYFFIPRLRDYYCAYDSDYDDDDENHNVIILSQRVVPLKYFIKISKQFLYYCLIIKLKFFYYGRNRRSCMICIAWRPSIPPSSSLYGVRIPVLKSPWILGGVLEKSLNSIFTWKVFKFLCKSLKCPWIFFSSESSGLKSVFFFNPFWLSKTRYKF